MTLLLECGDLIYVEGETLVSGHPPSKGPRLFVFLGHPLILGPPELVHCYMINMTQLLRHPSHFLTLAFVVKDSKP